MSTPDRLAALGHDPLCPSFYPQLIPAHECRYCFHIARVRDDERRKLAHACADNNCCAGDPRD